MEVRDLYDKDHNVTGKTICKGESVPIGYYCLVVVIIMGNSDGMYLIQKRSISKGGKWALTGGHPKKGETSIEGIITEVKEEIGLDISSEDIKLVTTKIVHDRMCDIYYVKMDINLGDVVMQKEEVSDVKVASKKEILSMINGDIFHKGHGKIFLDIVGD